MIILALRRRAFILLRKRACRAFILLPQRRRKEWCIMKEIFEQYGGVLITVVAVLAMVVLISAIVGSDESSTIGKAFSKLISDFIAHAQPVVKE